MINVYLSPEPSVIDDNSGIGRIVLAQYNHLEKYGIRLVSDFSQTDVTACHIEGQGRQVDVLHCHGIYYEDLPHEPYQGWHREANRRIAVTARAARAITVPSPWVAETFKRDMRIVPEVIGHGIDIDLWEPLPASERRGYALWGKSRPSDVCSPLPAVELARKYRVPVVSTFGIGEKPETLFTIGSQPFEKMRTFIRHASVYLATTIETWGIQTVEAMAAGVPVLGYRWGGTADLVEHGITGYLVEPGDVDGLYKGYEHIMANWQLYSDRAAITGQSYTWDKAMRAYADLYHRIAEEKASERHRVCVVITSYNYGKHLKGAIDSVLPQLDNGLTGNPSDEIVIVNDGSADNTHDRALDALAVHADLVHYINQTNQGVAAARNNGIAATDCEYVICLDADDQLAPDYIRVCREALKRDRALGIAYTGLGLLAEDGGIHPSPFPPAFDWEHQSSPGNPPRTCVPTAAMFRRALWERAGGYRQVFAPAEDAEFYTRGLSIGYTAKKVADEPWIWYRNHSAGASKTRKYFDYSAYHPWMKDRQFPFAAPSDKAPIVLSYARPLISVIIPVGPGHARYLPAALDSLLQQSYRQWEVIVVDDTGTREWIGARDRWGGNPDLPDFEPRSEKVYIPGEVEKALKPYPFARLLHTEGKQGPANARNLGLLEAQAPLTLFLDADDWLSDPDALRLMLSRQAQSGRYVYSDWVCFENGKDPWTDDAPPYDQRAWFAKGQHAVTALIPTDWCRNVGGFDEALEGWEDWDFFCKLAAKGYCGVRQPGYLLGYRKHSGTQREQSWNKRETLAPLIRKRYEGIEPMGCGCGPAGAALLRIRQSLTESDIMGADLQPGQVLMEYTGGRAGIQSVQSRTKRIDGQIVRYEYGGDITMLPVWEEDVTFLEGIGFRRALEAPVAVEITPESIGAAILGTRTATPAVAIPEAIEEVTEAPPESEPVVAAEIEAMFNQDRLSALTEEKAQQHRQRGRPRRNG